VDGVVRICQAREFVTVQLVIASADFGLVIFIFKILFSSCSFMILVSCVLHAVIC
jgi:hypothetical protein